MRYKIIYLAIIINSVLFSQESWNTNLIDYTWNKLANSMMYREPIIFTPFEFFIAMYGLVLLHFYFALVT